MEKATVEIHDSIEPLRAEWERLARQTKSSPFLWPGWVRAWWDAFGEGELRILAVYQDGRLTGVLPLRRFEGVLSSTANNETPLFGFLVAHEAAVEQLLGALFSQGEPRIDLLFLESTEAVTSLIRAVADAAGYEVLKDKSPLNKVPYVAINETSWEAYEGGLSRKLRSSLRRRRRQLEERGRLTLEVFDGKERLEELLEEGFRVEGSGWKDAEGKSINSSPAKRRFYTAVARWASERDWLRLYFLRLDGRVLAFDYCFECNKTLYGLKTGYDPAYGRFSPGMLLRHLMLARAFSEGLATCHLGGEFHPWKREWTDAYYEQQSLYMFTREGLEQDPWFYQVHLAMGEVAAVVPPGESFILVDEAALHMDAGGGRRAIPFVEWEGLYWGPPADDEAAIGELERLMQAGARFMVFAWPAFWWLEYYEELHRYLRSRFRCLLENERIVVFDLRRE
jgi:CelD/BcsL family acetyltransferase involved in cellulose biosynthesis